MEKDTIIQKLDALLNICVDKKTFGEKCETFVEKSVFDAKLQSLSEGKPIQVDSSAPDHKVVNEALEALK